MHPTQVVVTNLSKYGYFLLIDNSLAVNNLVSKWCMSPIPRKSSCLVIPMLYASSQDCCQLAIPLYRFFHVVSNDVRDIIKYLH